MNRRHSDTGAGASLDMAKRCAHDAPRWDSWARFFDNVLKPKAMRGKSEDADGTVAHSVRGCDSPSHAGRKVGDLAINACERGFLYHES